MSGITQISILIALFSGFLFEKIWYSSRVFGCFRNHNTTTPSYPVLYFIVTFLLSGITILVLALYLGENRDFISSLGAGLGIGTCFVATTFINNRLSTTKQIKNIFIDAGYIISQFTIYGAILGIIK